MSEMSQRVHARLAALPGVQPVRRPTTVGGDGFDLFYIRTGAKSRHPLVIVPGGPGVASIGHYRRLRRRAAKAGLDVIMVEHRGVGLSRRDDDGADLPPQALTVGQAVDDIAAVLDDARVDQAVFYGTSYGSYLAAGMGVRHPARVRAMILDSPLLGRRDIEMVREAVRGLLWEGDGPAAKIRRLRFTSLDAQQAATIFEIGGADLLDAHLDLLLRGRRRLWRAMGFVGRAAANRPVPYRNEADLVGPIGFRELNFGGTPDGLPLDPAPAMRRLPGGDTPFRAEPFDLIAELPGFRWPTVVVSGGRDLTTPPVAADRAAALVTGAVLVRLPTAGHSILDTRERAALRIAAEVCAGRTGELAAKGAELDALSPNPGVRALHAALAGVTRILAR